MNNAKKGFTLSEVLIATIVMSMIMGSVLAFVQYSGQIWYRGNEKISAQNYNRMAFELIKQDLLNATSVSLPSNVGKSSKKIIYNIGTKQYKISLEDYGTSEGEKSSTLVRTGQRTAGSGMEGDRNDLMRLARNVHYFYVRRISYKTFEITLQIKKEQTDEEIEEGIEPELVSDETVVVLAPGIE